MAELAIKDGRVFLPEGLEEVNIGITDGKISELSKQKIEAEEEIDARGRLVLPGLIDPHVHFREPGQTQKEDFFTGTSAAAAGGVTTILDMPNNVPPTDTVGRVSDKDAIVSQKAVVDYGLYLCGRKPEEVANYPLVKFYLDNSRCGVSREVFKECYGALAGQCVIHAEDGEMIKRGGKRSLEACIEGVKFVSSVFEGSKKKVHITHVTSGEEIGAAHPEITLGVTPHHLFLNEGDLKELGNFGKVNPPLRPKEVQMELWNHLESRITCIGTDHAPHLAEEKEAEDSKAPAGVPGVQDYLSPLLTKMKSGNITLEKIVQLTSENPADLFGLGNKGYIKEGKDADFVIIDPKAERVIRADEQKSKCGWTPYDGWKVRGRVLMTIVRGKKVFEDNGILVKKWGMNQHSY